jgi:ABC-type nitrate/sulfonate/bicarbonate transport system permease component
MSPVPLFVPRRSLPARPVPTWTKARRLLTGPNAIRVVSVLVFLSIWEYYGRAASPIFMAPPSAILKAAVELFKTGAMQRAMLQTLGPFCLGLLLTIVIGVVVGISIAQSKTLECVLDPFINALYAIPRVALVPLIILWAGLGFAGKVTIVVSTAVFPIIVNTYSGVRDVRGALLDVGRAYGCTSRQSFFKIILPSAVPFIMAGIRLAIGLAIIGIVVAEFFTAMSGLGGLIVEYSNNFATARLFVPIIVLAIGGVLLTEAVMFVERRISRWRISEQERF